MGLFLKDPNFLATFGSIRQLFIPISGHTDPDNCLFVWPQVWEPKTINKWYLGRLQRYLSGRHSVRSANSIFRRWSMEFCKK